jgi:hypothetical protein
MPWVLVGLALTLCLAAPSTERGRRKRECVKWALRSGECWCELVNMQ